MRLTSVREGRAAGRDALLVGDVDFAAGVRRDAARDADRTPSGMQRPFAHLPRAPRRSTPWRASCARTSVARSRSCAARMRPRTGCANLVSGKRIVPLATHGFRVACRVRGELREGHADYARSDALERVPARACPASCPASCSPARTARPTEGRHDGILTAEEVAWLDLSQCELITLSACDTGLGTPHAGECLLGLRRSLRLAGAHATLTSLWRVPRSSRARFLVEFYRRWLTLGMRSRAPFARPSSVLLAKQRAANGGQALVGSWGAFLLEGR